MKELKVLKFIKENPDWRELFQSKPYCIEIKEDDGLTLLKYNQIESDFYNDIVKECRGIILDLISMTPVCVPFFKFGNYGEGYSDDIDWNTARVLEKIDGSLIKVFYYNGKWRVSTNGTINAFNAEIANFGDIIPYRTFGDLFMAGYNKYQDSFGVLDPNTTYMFELVSPYNKVVVPYSDIDIYLIGIRNNLTLQEEYIKDSALSYIFKTPEEYPLQTLEDCIALTSTLDFTHEGHVILDNNFHRVKEKNPKYVAIHHLKGEGITTPKRMMELIQLNESEEFLNYFPEYKELYDTLKDKYDKYINYLEVSYNEFSKHNFESRKDLALFIKDNYKFPSYFFSRYDNKILSVSQYVSELRTEDLLHSCMTM
jgi:hypothetical protein